MSLSPLIQIGIQSFHSCAEPSLSSSAEPAAVALGMIGLTELWPLLLIALLLFGGRKLPELARAAGSSITQFKRGLKDDGGLLDEPDESGEKDNK